VIPLRDENPTRRRAYVTLALIAVNLAVYVLWQHAPGTPTTGAFEYEHAVIPCEVTTFAPLSFDEIQTGTCSGTTAGTDEVFPGKHVLVAVLVSLFLHGSVVHLVGNLLFLWVFGNNVEDRLGPGIFLGFYLVAGVLATLSHVALQPTSTVPLIGASGAIAGIMGAYFVWFPNARVLSWVFVFPLRIQARWLLLYWFASQFFLNPNEGVAWSAHVGGFVVGVLVALLI
jgi:membrane associated rhomboid family serine protease